MLIIRKALCNRIERVFEEIRIFLFPRGQIQVHEVSGSMVTNGVPVFAGSIVAERLCTRIQRDGIKVRKIPSLFSIDVVLVEQLNRLLHVPHDLLIASETVGHARTGKSVYLL